MGAFTVGYGAALVMVMLGKGDQLAGLTSTIFAAGAIFVLITVRLTVNLVSTVLRNSDALEDIVAARTRQLTEQAAKLEIARAESEAANQVKTNFLANMSHELRTPLNSIIGFAKIVARNSNGNLNEKERGYMQRITSSGRHLLGLIDDVLDVSKIEVDEPLLEIGPVDPSRIVGEVCEQMAPAAEAKGLTLRHESGDDFGDIEADAARMRQVLAKLIDNAIKFTPKGSVIVRAGAGGDRSIEVIDTGIGIAPHAQAEVFRPFFQADMSTSREHGGAGVGLAVCHRLCTMMGFDLTVQSEVGHGTTFRIEIPSRAQTFAAPAIQ